MGSDPLVDSLAAMLTVPLRELYALLWRAGVLEIVDAPASPVPARSWHPGTPTTLGASAAATVALVAIAMA